MGLWILEGGKRHCSNMVGLVIRPTIFDPNEGGATDSLSYPKIKLPPQKES